MAGTRSALVAAALLAITALTSCGTSTPVSVSPADVTTTSSAPTSPSVAPPSTLPPTSAAPTTTSASPVQLSERFGPAVARVLNLACGSAGTAFAVDDRHFVTNAHVVLGDQRPSLQLHDGSTITGGVIGVDETLDIAVIEASAGTAAAPASWADSAQVKEGQPLTVLGYPAPGGYAVITVDVRSISTDPRDYGTIQTTAGIDAGNSGSPALTAQGQVAGVVAALGVGEYEAYGVVLPAEKVEPVVARMIAHPSNPSTACLSEDAPTPTPPAGNGDSDAALVDQAVALAEQFTRAVVDEDWATAARLTTDWSPRYEAGYAPLVAAWNYPARWKVDGTAVRLWFGEVAHETVDGKDQTSLWCIHWDVDVERQIITRVGGRLADRFDGFRDPAGLADRASTECRSV